MSHLSSFCCANLGADCRWGKSADRSTITITRETKRRKERSRLDRDEQREIETTEETGKENSRLDRDEQREIETTEETGKENTVKIQSTTEIWNCDSSLPFCHGIWLSLYLQSRQTKRNQKEDRLTKIRQGETSCLFSPLFVIAVLFLRSFQNDW